LKNIVSKRLIVFLVILFVLMSFVLSIEASYPSKKINIFIPYGSGGTTDVLCRHLAKHMSKYLGEDIIISTLSGAGGSIALEHVRNQAADGHTLLGFSHSLLLQGTMGNVEDNMDWYEWYWFIAGTASHTVAVTSDSEFKSVSDLVDAARKNPGKVIVGSSGVGGPSHAIISAIEAAADVQFNVVNYPGGAPLLRAILGKEVQAGAFGIIEPLEHAKSGDLKLLCVANEPGESLELEGVGVIPSISEDIDAIKDYLPVIRYQGFVVNRNTPPEVVSKIVEAFEYAMEQESVQTYIKNAPLKLGGITGEQSDKMISWVASLDTWGLEGVGAAVVSPDQFGIPTPDEYKWPPESYPAPADYIPWPDN